LREDGRALLLQLLGSRLAEPGPEVLAVFCDSRSLDQRPLERERLVEAEREARQANAAKDDFIAALSHELRTPLTPVLAAASALQQGEFTPAQLPSLYEIISRNVNAEARLIDDLLDVTRITRGKLRLDLEIADVHRILRDALATFSERIAKKRHRVVVELEARRHFAHGDPVRLKQVFWNLIGNAVKFTPNGGTIAIRSWDHDREISIQISDSGDGIEESMLSKIFAPFEQGERHTQARTGGLGLGLAICKGLIELHGGRIDASSPGRGKGARFVVDLGTVPAPTASEAPPASDEVTEAALELPKPHILLVEDDADSAEALELALDAAGYDVTVAKSGRQALELDLDAIDLIVSDIGLPDMTGHEFLRTLHQTRKVPAIALSGYGTERDIRASRSVGFVAHLTKPIELNALITAIQKAMLVTVKAQAAKPPPTRSRSR
jgi:signal transduction histidine kinase/ActR/RegA family two-component response regulator